MLDVSGIKVILVPYFARYYKNKFWKAVVRARKAVFIFFIFLYFIFILYFYILYLYFIFYISDILCFSLFIQTYTLIYKRKDIGLRFAFNELY